MKSHYTITKLALYFLSLIVVTTLVSCGAAQTVSGNDDGIYAEDEERPQRRIVQTNDREYDDYNENYFKKEVERLDDLNGTDILTDIENYSSDDYDFEDEIEDEDQGQISTNREPWGFDGDSDVVINVNTFGNNWGWGYGPYWNVWGDPFWGNP